MGGTSNPCLVVNPLTGIISPALLTRTSRRDSSKHRLANCLMESTSAKSRGSTITSYPVSSFISSTALFAFLMSLKRIVILLIIGQLPLSFLPTPCDHLGPPLDELSDSFLSNTSVATSHHHHPPIQPVECGAHGPREPPSPSKYTLT